MMQLARPFSLALAATVLCANAQDEVPELSFFERAELPEATLTNAADFDERLIESHPSINIPRDVTGTATINVLVTTNGRAVRCQIKKSSGDNIIDQWACRGTIRYARFAPATDDEGNPTLGQWTESFTLTLGDPDKAEAPAEP